MALLEASLSPPSYSWAAPQSDPGLRAGPTVSTPPTEGSPVGPPMLEPRSVYNMEAKTTVIVNPTPEDIAQLGADLQTEIPPYSEEPRTPIASGCVAVEDAASHECGHTTFIEEIRRPIRSSLLPRPVKTKRAPIPPPQGQLELPKCNKRLANHPLANVASSKCAEVMLMRRFNVIPDVAAPNSDSKKAYMQLYKGEARRRHFEAMRDLLPALRSSSAMGFTIK